MNLRFLFIGDVVGITGRAMLEKHLPSIQEKYRISATIVNGENAADGGKGITPRIMEFFKENKVTVVTSGNHIWYKKEIIPYISSNKDLLRPANFPAECPGSGFTLFHIQDQPVAVINMQGRVFMRELLDCPFKKIETILSYLRDKTKIIFIDFHAETTAEKMCFAHFVAGKVSGVVGTHTHVQTADERILPEGTAFITDLGMVGALDSSLGMQKGPIIHNFLTQMPIRFHVETTGPVVLNGVWIEVDSNNGKANIIERIKLVDDKLYVQESKID